MIETKIKQSIKKNCLIEPEDRVLVAYSGGADSTALLTLLQSLYRDNRIAAVYVNHQLRGKESREEEEFVRLFCNNRNIPLFVETIQWKKRPSDLEQAARKRRYRHFAKVAREQGFQKIALAHHRDDVVETFLLHLIRGSGPRGLGGLHPKRDIYIRPMLDCTRKEVLAYLKRHRIRFFTDTSNFKLDFARNNIRHRFIPLIEEELNPQFSTAIYRTSQWIAEQNRLLLKLLEPYKTLIKKQTQNSWSVNRSEWEKMDPDLQKAFLRLILPEMDPNLQLNSKSLQNLVQSIQETRAMELPGYLKVQNLKDSILFLKKNRTIGLTELDVPFPGTYRFAPGNATLSFSITSTTDYHPAPNVAYLDAQRASFPLYIRNWKKGDSFRPLGMKGRKKLSDFLIDKKVPKQIRKMIPLVYKDDDLIWLAGYQIHHDYRVTPGTSKLLRIELQEDA
jgi:tRNA(Ile)-lysidine synthase